MASEGVEDCAVMIGLNAVDLGGARGAIDHRDAVEEKGGGKGAEQRNTSERLRWI